MLSFKPLFGDPPKQPDTVLTVVRPNGTHCKLVEDDTWGFAADGLDGGWSLEVDESSVWGEVDVVLPWEIELEH